MTSQVLTGHERVIFLIDHCLPRLLYRIYNVCQINIVSVLSNALVLW